MEERREKNLHNLSGVPEMVPGFAGESKKKLNYAVGSKSNKKGRLLNLLSIYPTLHSLKKYGCSRSFRHVEFTLLLIYCSTTSTCPPHPKTPKTDTTH